MFGRQQRAQFPKRSSSGYSWPESDSDDDIVIRPCASDEKADASVTMTEYVPASAAVAVEQPASSRGSLTGHRSSVKNADLEALWECMLELQQKYHCYNSTRMEIAADSEDAMGMMPTKYCMDMLNDSIESLPEEGWKKLSKFLVTDFDTCQKSQKWKFWKHG
ncbi:hypothetical protein LX36DRAFT_653030 [Colletotrichum falcatum]|nr:hypothetical protein LX36DRAFT_653030 [Colletotrichum falcatum]